MADGGTLHDVGQTAPAGAAQATDAYTSTRNRVETYFDSTATRTWERLTSDAPVSGIRATVRAGRDEMRSLISNSLPQDLRGARILDAGCGTGALAFDLAGRGAQVTGVDISPQLIDIAKLRTPDAVADKVSFAAGDMLDPALGRFDYIVAMDSMIYYSARDIAAMLDRLAPRLDHKMIFTVAPRTPLLMAMWRVGKLFPRSDRSPTMIPHTPAALAAALTRGKLRDLNRVTSGFYISHAMEFLP
ncbi:magnesium protoporphyrin IX methyltransferase [Sulfitobacter sp. HNIBRBA3233]|uniref:magnesium protoporphyrin IX methyltransferase n=1 Tax=Sulfitobacter marinivivus TaxID=3158558 RepID=UPI0032DFEC9B